MVNKINLDSFSNIPDQEFKKILSETHESLNRIHSEGLRVLQGDAVQQLREIDRLGKQLQTSLVKPEFIQLIELIEKTNSTVFQVINELKSLKDKQTFSLEERKYAEGVQKRAVIAKTIEQSIDNLDLITNPNRQAELLMKILKKSNN